MRTGKMLSISWENLKRRRLRTSLTTLGVVIGITTIIALASLGEGFRFSVKQRMEQGFELDMIIVFPATFAAAFGQPFTKENITSIQTIENITLITPLITWASPNIQNTANNEKLGAYTIGAVNFTEMQEMIPQRFRLMPRGHFPTSAENQSIILGYKAATLNNTLIANVGNNITLSVRVTPYFTYYGNFTVAGILEKGGTSGITNFDNWAFIPLSTATKVPGVGENYQIILVKVSDLKYAEQVGTEIENKFPPHSITVFVASSLMRQVDNILNMIQLFLLAIASISLLVAGVGIMNIMTVSVMERTREIGILKAIGAKSRTVLAMFLTETLLIGLIGGLIGIAAGYGLSHGLAYALGIFLQPSQGRTGIGQNPDAESLTITPIFSPIWTIIAFAFAIIVCVIFGLYPARKAAKLDPVKALRYE